MADYVNLSFPGFPRNVRRFGGTWDLGEISGKLRPPSPVFFDYVIDSEK